MPLMGIPSFSELIIIAAVVFLLFGAKKLPELGGAIGESIKNFKKGIKDDEPEAKRLADAARVEVKLRPQLNQTRSNRKTERPSAAASVHPYAESS